jgi:hypothetical protein
MWLRKDGTWRHSVREGKRVKSERCLWPEHNAAVIAEVKKRKRLERERWQARLAELREQDARLEEAARAVMDLAARVYAAAGYVRHNRGWRRQRRARTMGEIMAAKNDAAAELLRAAEKEVARLQWPDGDVLLDHTARVMHRLYYPQGKKTWAKRSCAVLARVERLRDALVREGHGSTIELLLIERVLAAWVSAYEADERATFPPAGCTLAYQEVLHKRRDAAHRRLVAALEALAKLRAGPLVVLIGALPTRVTPPHPALENRP